MKSVFQKILNSIFITEQTWQSIILFIIFIIAALFRIGSYYNRTSIGNNDTQRFIQSAEIPFFSVDFFTSNRPPTITTLYKIMQPSSGYKLSLVSEPGLEGSGSELDRLMQPGLDRIVLAQSAISIFCWMTLAWIFSRHQRSFPAKVISSTLILIFAFSPQLADWDGVLLSEPISFALFALVLAFTIELFFSVRNHENKATVFTLICWIISVVFWVFSRDTNAYFVLMTIILLGLVLVFNKTRKYIPSHLGIITLLTLTLLFYVHNQSLRSSDRWINPFFNNIIMHVLPYEDRVEFFQNLGMPVNSELMAFEGHCCGVTGVYELGDLMQWVTSSGYSSYSRFLLAHPLWATNRVFQDIPFLFSENRQPFFFGTPTTTPMWLIPLGNILHPTSSLVIWIDFFLIAMILLYAFKIKDTYCYWWTSLFVYLFVIITGLLFVSYLGDAAGLIRHCLVAVMPYRLMIWMLISCILDSILITKKQF